MIRMLSLFAVAALSLVTVSAATADIIGQASVVDGDTLDIRGERVRLDGIDAPEGGQWCLDGSGNGYRCGQVAAFALSDMIGRQTVRCSISGQDQYGRHIGRCSVGGLDMNGWLVRHGHALAYRDYSLDYVADEDIARENRAGIWLGQFDAPWDWRRGNRAIGEGGVSVASDKSRECNIKGNISSERIYHSPG